MPYSNFIFCFADTELQSGNTFVLNDGRLKKKCYVQLCSKRDILTAVQVVTVGDELSAVQ